MKLETVLIAGLYFLAIIGCVISYHLGAEMEKLKHDASISDPGPTAEWVKRLIPDGASSATNPAPFDRRRRPILHVSDHIEKLIDD
jgi:hypothetical protein